MYLFKLRYSNAARNREGELILSDQQGRPKKWNIIKCTPEEYDSELLRLLALAGSGCTDYLDQLALDLTELLQDKSRNLQIEFVWQEHKAINKRILQLAKSQSAVAITPSGQGKRLRQNDNYLLPLSTRYSTLSKWSPPAKHPLFAYGAAFRPHRGSDDFDFSDPFYQLRRIHSLFTPEARITDPEAFLQNLHYRAIDHRRYMPAQILQSLQRLLNDQLDLDTSEWMQKGTDFKNQWSRFSDFEQQLMLPIIDPARHLHDALPSCPNPLNFPGIMLLDRPDNYCPPECLPAWICLLDKLFPALQFVTTLPQTCVEMLPEHVVRQSLVDFAYYSEYYPQKSCSKKQTRKLPAKSILLIDVDGRLPNMALMKLSTYFKNNGYNIQLERKEAYDVKPEAVFASSVFNFDFSKQRIKNLRKYYGQAINCGGSGLDLKKSLPEDIENCEPDYDLYPELDNRAIGFLTRGCPFSCQFCIVPVKEGKPRLESDLQSLTRNKRDKLILLDDNILAYQNCKDLLEEMVRRKLKVNFNQTLDLTLVDKEKAELLRSIYSCNVKCNRQVYHFSLNDNNNLEQLRDKYELFNFSGKDNVEFICMYGFNTTLAEDLERFSFLRSLPGAYVFVQEYMPIIGGPQPQLEDYFDDKVDEYIDQLVRICFPQCMKSMEKYFRWLSRLYAQKFGKLHMGLVDTIFRYNTRYKRGRYIASLAGTRKMP